MLQQWYLHNRIWIMLQEALLNLLASAAAPYCVLSIVLAGNLFSSMSEGTHTAVHTGNPFI